MFRGLIKALGLLLRPLTRPAARFLVGVLAIPLFRFLVKKIFRVKELGEEFEKDIEQWFRGAFLLLFATRNMEIILAETFPVFFSRVQTLGGPDDWLLTGLRILLAIGVIEAMPDQELFSIVYPGPPKPILSRKNFWATLKPQLKPIFYGILCKHLNRSSPVFAILATITKDGIGWTCYWLAIIQYLIIGLITSRDQAMEVLSRFDQQVALRRSEIISEFDIEEKRSPLPDQDEDIGPIESGPPEAAEESHSDSE